MKRCIYYITILLWSASCKQAGTLTSTDKAALETEVKQMFANYNNDIREQGLLAEFPYLDSSDEFFWVPPGYMSALSYDSVAKAIRTNAAAIKKIDNNWDTLLVTVLGQEIACYTGKMRSPITDTLGKTFTTVLIESGTIVKRSNG